MRNIKALICQCGSGKPSYWRHDADGIPLCRTCPDCHKSKMGRYRPDILTVSSRRYEERLDPEDY